LSFSTLLLQSTVNSQQSTTITDGVTGIDIIPKQALIKVPHRESAYSPDVLVINQKNLSSQPLWKKSSTVTQAASVPLVIEVVSTNWQDDYAHTLVDYEILGIPEYWIIDYLGLGCGMCSKLRIWICWVIVAIAPGIICG